MDHRPTQTLTKTIQKGSAAIESLRSCASLQTMRIENVKMYQLKRGVPSLYHMWLVGKFHHVCVIEPKGKSTNAKKTRTRVSACRNSSMEKNVARTPKFVPVPQSKFRNPKSGFFTHELLVSGPKTKIKIRNQNLKFQIHNSKPKIRNPNVLVYRRTLACGRRRIGKKIARLCCKEGVEKCAKTTVFAVR